MFTVGFLGYDQSKTGLIGFLESRGVKVDHHADPLTNLGMYDLCVSFGYRHILTDDILKTANRPALNLHISYLPYNRGAHPNFWSWLEGTPSGVTIHEIDTGLDTGPIVAQRVCGRTNMQMSFAQSYRLLVQDIEALFRENWASIISGNYRAVAQAGSGTYHNSRDLPVWMDSWDMKIYDAMDRFSKDS